MAESCERSPFNGHMMVGDTIQLSKSELKIGPSKSENIKSNHPVYEDFKCGGFIIVFQKRIMVV